MADDSDDGGPPCAIPGVVGEEAPSPGGALPDDPYAYLRQVRFEQRHLLPQTLLAPRGLRDACRAAEAAAASTAVARTRKRKLGDATAAAAASEAVENVEEGEQEQPSPPPRASASSPDAAGCSVWREYFRSPRAPAVVSARERALLPSPEWEDSFLRDWARARDAWHAHPPPACPLDALPGRGDAGAWRRFCFGTEPSEEEEEEEEEEGEEEGEEGEVVDEHRLVGAHPPDDAVLARLDQRWCISLLKLHVRWLEERRARPSTNACACEEAHAAWLAGLLFVLLRPLAPTASSLLRRLLQLLCAERLKLGGSQHPLLPRLNGLVTVLTRFFGQRAASLGS